MKNYSFGHPKGYSLTDKELQGDQLWVDEGFAAYAHTPQIEAAQKYFEDLLYFKRQYNWTHHVQAEQQMERLVRAGITPADLFKRVAAFYTYLERCPTRYRTPQEERFGLARVVLRLAKMGKYRPTSRLLSFLGQHIAEGYASVACAFVRKLTKDSSARDDLKQRATNWNESP